MRLKDIKIDHKEIIDFYLSGNSMANVTRKFNIGINNVIKILKINNISTKLFKKDFNNIDWQTYDIGLLIKKHDGSINAIHNETNIPWAYIKRYMKEHGLSKLNYRYEKVEGIPENLTKIIVELFLSGKSNKSISLLTKVSTRNISKIIKKEGIIKLRELSLEKRKKELLVYSKKARRLSYVIRRQYGKEKAQADNHWNHKFSILDGFINSVPLEIISSMANQELILSHDNLVQGAKSKITMDELKQLLIVF